MLQLIEQKETNSFSQCLKQEDPINSERSKLVRLGFVRVLLMFLHTNQELRWLRYVWLSISASYFTEFLL